MDKRTALAAVGMNDRLRLASEANLVDSIYHAKDAGATWGEIGQQIDGGYTVPMIRGWLAEYHKREDKGQTFHKGQPPHRR